MAVQRRGKDEDYFTGRIESLPLQEISDNTPVHTFRQDTSQLTHKPQQLNRMLQLQSDVDFLTEQLRKLQQRNFRLQEILQQSNRNFSFLNKKQRETEQSYKQLREQCHSLEIKNQALASRLAQSAKRTKEEQLLRDRIKQLQNQVNEINKKHLSLKQKYEKKLSCQGQIRDQRIQARRRHSQLQERLRQYQETQMGSSFRIQHISHLKKELKTDQVQFLKVQIQALTNQNQRLESQLDQKAAYDSLVAMLRAALGNDLNFISLSDLVKQGKRGKVLAELQQRERKLNVLKELLNSFK